MLGVVYVTLHTLKHQWGMGKWRDSSSSYSAQVFRVAGGGGYEKEVVTTIRMWYGKDFYPPFFQLVHQQDVGKQLG